MINTNEHFEKISSEITYKIYPYLIQDLKENYNHSFENKSILEIGVGPGHLFEQVIKCNFRTSIGIDISNDMLDRARKRCNLYNNDLLKNASAENLPFKNNEFDIVLSRGSVFFWDNLNICFKEIFRVLKKDGLAFIGGGYGLSTPDNIIDDIFEYYKTRDSKKEKPKLDPWECANMMNNIGGYCEVLMKKKHGFWLKWNK